MKNKNIPFRYCETDKWCSLSFYKHTVLSVRWLSASEHSFFLGAAKTRSKRNVRCSKIHRSKTKIDEKIIHGLLWPLIFIRFRNVILIGNSGIHLIHAREEKCFKMIVSKWNLKIEKHTLILPYELFTIESPHRITSLLRMLIRIKNNTISSCTFFQTSRTY